MRKQELREKGPESSAHRLPSLEIFELMGRTLSAFMALPVRMARCRTPLDAWNEQAQLLRGIAEDCQSVALRMMTAGVIPLSRSRSTQGRKNW